MEIIVPCRSTISERFPIASFMVRLPRERLYEVACATDPRLFHTAYAAHRTRDNFYTSREAGLLAAGEGESTFFIPPHQLRRFAGSRRIYYALGSYGGRNGENARFSIAPNELERVPSIGVGADFTGRSLDRARLGRLDGAAASAVYGSPARGTLRWGGDAALDAEREVPPPAVEGAGYDDGYDPTLWRATGQVDGDADPAAPVADDDGLAKQNRRGGGGTYETSTPASLAWDHAYGDDGHREEDGGAPTDGQFAGEGLAAAGDADAAQDSDDGEPLGFEDGGDFARRDGRGAGAADDAAMTAAGDDDDLASDLGVDPDDAEDGADHRTRHADAAPGTGGQAANGATNGYGYGDPSGEAPRYGRGPGALDADAHLDDDAGLGFGVPGVLGEKEASYHDEDVPEDSLPVGPAATALGVEPLTVAEKVRILRVVGRADTGAAGYAAVNADTEFHDRRHAAYHLYHLGLGWGLLMFNQRSGALGRVLRKADVRERAALAADPQAIPHEHRLATLFGPDWPALLATTDPDHTPDPEDRVAPVGGKVLWEEPWLGRFQAAGQIPYVQWAQNEVGVVDFFDRMLPLARGLGLDTARGLALLVDRAVHMGVGRGSAWIMNAVGAIHSEADRAAALRALGHGPDDLRGFQRSQAGAGLTADGRWTPVTHAALMGALRGLGADSPVPLPARDGVERALIEAARGTAFEARVLALAANHAELDGGTAFELG